MKMKMAAALAALALLGGVAQASAYTLTFENVQFPGTGIPIMVAGGGGEVATFSAPGSQFESFQNDPSLPLMPGAYHLTAGGGATPITIAFSKALSSVTLPIFAYAIDPVTTTVSFYDGAQILGSVTNQEASNLTAEPMFSFAGNITSIVIDTPASSAGFPLGVQIDPISYTLAGGVSPVPLPASAPMFGAAILALAGFGYAAKRKKAAVV